MFLFSGRAAAASWLSPVDLSTPNALSDAEPYPQIAMADEADAVAVWQHYNGSRLNLQVASMSPAGTWGAPVTLAPDIYDQNDPQVAMNESGEAVVVWEQLGEEATPEAKMRSPSGEWGPRESISDEQGVFGMDVAIDPAGEAVAVWSEFPRFSSLGDYRIEASVRPVGGHWGTPQTISEVEYGVDSYDPTVAITPTGQIVVAWWGYYNQNEERTVEIAEGQGGDWGPPHVLSGQRSSWSPKVVSSAAGATVIWTSEGGWIEAASRPTGGQWGQAVELSGPRSTKPRIGMDASGKAIAIWSSDYTEEGEYIESSTLPMGGDWSEPTEISGKLVVASTEPEIAVAPSGEMLATWSNWSDGGRVVEDALGSSGEWDEPARLSPVGTWAIRPNPALDGEGDGAVVWWSESMPQATEFVVPRPSKAGDSGTHSPVPESISPQNHSQRAIARRVAVVRKNKVYLGLRCPVTGPCEGDLRLVAPAAEESGRAVSISSGRVNFVISAGGEKTVVIGLNKKGRNLFSAAGDKGARIRLAGDEVKSRSILLKPAG